MKNPKKQKTTGNSNFSFNEKFQIPFRTPNYEGEERRDLQDIQMESHLKLLNDTSQKEIDNLTKQLKNESFILNLPKYLKSIFNELGTKYASLHCKRNNLKDTISEVKNHLDESTFPTILIKYQKFINKIPEALQLDFIKELNDNFIKEKTKKILELNEMLKPESIKQELDSRLKPFFDNNTLEKGNFYIIILETNIKSILNNFISKQEKDKKLKEEKREKLSKKKETIELDNEKLSKEIFKLKNEIKKIKIFKSKNSKGTSLREKKAVPTKTKRKKDQKKKKKNSNTKNTSVRLK